MSSILEAQQRSQLELQRNSIQRQATETRVALRKGLTAAREDGDSPATEGRHKMALEALRNSGQNGIVNTLDKQGGAMAGEWAGGLLGSILPGPGTAIGIFLGRFFGKRLGISGIIFAALLLIGLEVLFTLIILFVLLQGYCGTTFGQYIDKTTVGICKSVGLSQNTP